ncbi:response regulator transcription factor [Paenibacillus tarimensis]|uniref:response regulator transcription factor n=1 Tax=Paenibacillus tarimensis TaxID=416012 RepID=UPI001F20A14C|nr:response regulator transcription factor [Paenibacillus tarimensis]MCF2943446.1 response regulator transcription factor [Paenibacillus tarimensis]
MSKLQILVVDDEWNMRNLLRVYLTKNGFQVSEAANGHEALQVIERGSYDLILLDVMLPDMDGWEVCKRVRQTKQTPIIMLTARTETKDKVQGFTLGADDYVVKPFEPDELIARIFALLRRANSKETDLFPISQIEYNDLLISSEARQVKVKDRPVDFTPKEFDLLRFLAEHPNRAFTRDICLEQVWGEEFFGDTRTV